MGVLRFTIDDYLQFGTLASALANVSDGAHTLAVLVKRASVNNDQIGEGLSYLLSGAGAGTAEVGLSIRDTTPDTDDNKLFIDNGGTAISSSTFTSTSSPYLFVLSKAAGTVTPRLGWQHGRGGKWTHEAFSATVADQIAATMLQIGTWQQTDPLDGWVGLIAWWEGAMIDQHKELLSKNWRTSDWWTSQHGQPAFLAELNVAGASVVDLAGNATGLTVVGTTLDSAETLQDWKFDAKGPPTVIEGRELLKQQFLRTGRLAA